MKNAPPSDFPFHASDVPELLKLLVEVGVGVWRTRNKMIQPGTDEPLDEMAGAFRHLDSIWVALTSAGVRIIDPVGEPFRAGMTMKVLAFQPTPGLRRETIIETVKPVIIYKTMCIEAGEVIVGTPAP